MYTRPHGVAPDGVRGHIHHSPRPTAKYDWRLWGRRRERYGGDAGLAGGPGSMPDALPPGLFSYGSHNSHGSRGSGGGSYGINNNNNNSSGGGSSLLLYPGRTPTSSSQPPTPAIFDAATPMDSGFRLSRTTSVDSAFDDEQGRCIHAAYKITFPNDKRIKEKPYRVVINGVSFVLVERVVSGHSDGVYQKNKKVWEHVPRGQVRVFLSIPTTPLGSVPPSPKGDGSARGSARRGRSTSPLTGSPTGSSYAAGSHTMVAALSGLRKFAHWGDTSANIYNVNKDVPVSAVAMEKIDGVGCHVAAFSVEEERYWVVGLRDRHLLVRLEVPEEDVQAFGTELYAAGDGAGSNNASQPIMSPDMSVSSPPPAAAATGMERTTTAASMRVARAWRALLGQRLSAEEIVELHAELAAAQHTLCFDAVVPGCEQLVDYYGSDDDEEDANDPVVPQDALRAKSLEGGGTGAAEGPPAVTSPLSGTASSNSASGMLSISSRTAGMEEEDCLPIFFYAITTGEPSAKGLCLPVHEATAFLERYRLPTAAMSEPLEVNSPEYDAERARITTQLGSAGAVFYGTNEDGLVVRLWKCRCHAHDFERAAQEFIVTHRLHGELFQAKFSKKLSGLAKEARAVSLVWEKERLPFLVSFSNWLHRTRQLTPSTDLAALQELRGHWITAQHAFRHDVDEGQAAGVCGEDGEVCDAVATGADDSGGEDDAFMPETILLMGPQGSGKSTLARALYTLLEQCGCVPRWINQDEVGNRRAYLTAIERAATSGQYTHLILDKMNLDEASRRDYVDLNLKTVLTVAWRHVEGTQALADVCFERVKRRGTSHRTFKITVDLEEPSEAPAKSANSSQPLPTSTEGNGESGTSPKTPAQRPSLPGPVTTAVSPQAPTDAGGTDEMFRRMRGIVQDCAVRYEIPDADDGLLEIDITLNCNATIQRVWGRLQQRSLFELPDISTLQTEEAFHVAFGYEELMRAYPHRITAATLQPVSVAELRALVPAEVAECGGKKYLEQPQLMVHNFVEEPSPSALVRYSALIGKVVSLNVLTVVADAKATVLHVGGSALDGPQTGQGSSDSAQSSAATPSSANMVVLAKMKKATYRYCAQLLERVLRPGAAADPYVTVLSLPPGATATFAYGFVTSG